MKILALEFSSPQRSVAVVENHFGQDEADGSGSGYPRDKLRTRMARPSEVLGEASESSGQSVPPLRLIDQALQVARVERGQIDCVAVGLGPGSYNGIRSAIALAQGWQLASGVKLLGMSSVECIAAQAQAERVFGSVNVVIDAQRGEFYLATYDITDKWQINTSFLKIISLKDFKIAVESENLVVGPEVGRWFPAGRLIFPRAAILGQLAATRDDFFSGELLEPIYLRATTFVKAPPARIM